MTESPHLKTLVRGESDSLSRRTGLPADLLAQAAKRLRILALLYAFCFFMSDPLTSILVPEARGDFLADPIRWAPATISIAIALIVAASTWSRQIPVNVTLALGLVFEVTGSFGIATAQFLDGSRYLTEPPWAGLSWVAVWMLGYTVIVPSPPRRALLAALASASSVPIVVGSVMFFGGAPMLPARPFFFALVLPYLLVVLIAYVGARILYRLGTEVTRARELGSYRLVERLGQGGMGEVWRAKHRLLARPAAVKLMRPEVLGLSSLERRSELQARFEREAQATASLRSPHTIELYDFGVTDAGAFYYVMELLDGFDLDTLIRRFGPLPAERAVYVLKQVCHSLAEAHAEGMVHRDIKPANIYVCRRGRDLDFVKVLDFGLVKSHGASAVTQMNLTQDHALGGTPAFMAPEQVLGDRDLDGRSDIYAVGCVGYWLVTGQLVFSGRNLIETMMLHVNGTPNPPSARTETAVPRAFDALILECLAKSPDARPSTAEVLAARLASVEPESAWTPTLMHQWWDAHGPVPPRVGLRGA